MKRDEAKKLLPVIQAFAEGKVVQMKDSKGSWIHNPSPTFSPVYEYRIKPEPLECWVVKSREVGTEVYETLHEAEHRARWSLGPCTIHHMREVI